ncbi:hypothetical protein G7046_g7932 [Stylonectria norvegica]|nr:hypothetical protein G7046_g7932 [Stylonectria norvegica]
MAATAEAYSPRPSPPTKTFRKCKACQPCREKKIKCDGQQPICTQCRQHGCGCKYGHDRRQTSRITKGSIDTVYNKIASLESMLKKSMETQTTDIHGNFITQHPDLITQTSHLPALVPNNTRSLIIPPQLSPQTTSPDRLQVNFASSDHTIEPFFSRSSYIGDAPGPSDAIDPGRHLHGTDRAEHICTDVSATVSTIPQESQPQFHITPGSSATHSTGPPRLSISNDEAEGSRNAPVSPSSTSSPGLRRVTTAAQDSNNNGIMVSNIHVRVSNSVHGLTSTFHPQPVSPRTPSQISLSASPGQPPSQSAASTSRPQQELQHHDNEVRNRLFMYAVSERQMEYACRVEQRYDLDGVDYETALHLLDIHWNHQHCAYLLTYRPAILHSLITRGPHANKLLLNALYYSSSLNSDRNNLREPGPDGKSMSDKFLARFQELLLPELQRSSVSNAVAFLQMGSSLFANGSQTAGWLYSGIGYRMIVDLGLHLDPGKIQSPGVDNREHGDTQYSVDIELQRRLFWGAYVNDKFQSLFFGRPPALPLTGAEPPPAYADTYEELELWAPYIDHQNPSSLLSRFSPKPGYVVSCFRWLLRLAEISSDITEYLYMPAICNMENSTILQRFSRIKHDLDQWSQELPAHLRFEPEKDAAPPAHLFNIHTTYCTLKILLHRPFLPEGHLSHFHGDEMSARETCVWAALRIYRLAVVYRDTYTLRRAPYLFSYALFCAATVVPNHDGPELASLSRKEITVFFWNALIELQKGSNLGLKRPLKIIREFMERAGVDVQQLAGRLRTAPGSPAAPGHASTRDWNQAQDATDALDFSFDTDDFRLTDLNMDNINWSSEDMDGGFGVNEDILYGLFRSS